MTKKTDWRSRFDPEDYEYYDHKIYQSVVDWDSLKDFIDTEIKIAQENAVIDFHVELSRGKMTLDKFVRSNIWGYSSRSDKMGEVKKRFNLKFKVDEDMELGDWLESQGYPSLVKMMEK